MIVIWKTPTSCSGGGGALDSCWRMACERVSSRRKDASGKAGGITGSSLPTSPRDYTATRQDSPQRSQRPKRNTPRSEVCPLLFLCALCVLCGESGHSPLFIHYLRLRQRLLQLLHSLRADLRLA